MKRWQKFKAIKNQKDKNKKRKEEKKNRNKKIVNISYNA